MVAETQEEGRARVASERAAMKILVRGRMQLFQVSQSASPPVSQSMSHSP